MRVWFSGPRLLHGLVRPGISLGKEDFRSARKAPAMVAEATLGLFRRPDGTILMAIAHMNEFSWLVGGKGYFLSAPSMNRTGLSATI